jgi:uncharacterized membrane protein
MPALIWTAFSKLRKCGDLMYSNATSSLAAGSVSASGAMAAAGGGGGGGEAFWMALGGFAILAATTAVWRIVPRKEK